jgi:hypothetical protein
MPRAITTTQQTGPPRTLETIDAWRAGEFLVDWTYRQQTENNLSGANCNES